jgi:hypothetical protein
MLIDTRHEYVVLALETPGAYSAAALLIPAEGISHRGIISN